MADDLQPDNSQPEDGQPSDKPYQELVGYEWTKKAYHMLESGDLHGEAISRDKIVRSRVRGPCPRCGHALDDQQTHTAVISIMGTETRGWPGRGHDSGSETGSPFEIDVSCGCDDMHSGAPEGTTGCGVSFRVALPLQLAEGNTDRA
jgi:hypothetical protein